MRFEQNSFTSRLPTRQTLRTVSCMSATSSKSFAKRIRQAHPAAFHQTGNSKAFLWFTNSTLYKYFGVPTSFVDLGLIAKRFQSVAISGGSNEPAEMRRNLHAPVDVLRRELHPQWLKLCDASYTPRTRLSTGTHRRRRQPTREFANLDDSGMFSVVVSDSEHYGRH